ncbi:MAG TPA: metallopeptidase family protein [Solirubrobacterales bacterium]|mgnify:FL=1|jgi:predicted Zn-dependent protease with MMP-like domain
MRETFGPPLRAAAIAAFIAGVALLLLNPPSLDGVNELITLLVAVLAIVLLTAWGVVALTGEEMSEREYRRLTARSEKLAAQPPPERPLTEFDQLVIDALDALPPEIQKLLEDTPVVISNRGREHFAYGHYFGDTFARRNYHNRIVIYQDTLERDFGHDPELLRAQVERTVRHEVAHHLGWGEAGVRRLGL